MNIQELMEFIKNGTGGCICDETVSGNTYIGSIDGLDSWSKALYSKYGSYVEFFIRK